jgi:site-specific DNA recombinase
MTSPSGSKVELMKKQGTEPGAVRAVAYARYSSDMQSQSSIEDQLRLCRAFADRQGWQLTGSYSDRALSGASLLRPQLQKMLEDSRSGQFDIVVAEALDRLSRDQADVAGLYKRLHFQGVQLVTCSEGEISELHVGLKGTMNALFLKDLAAKTHRGLEGRVRKGRSAGGLTYGYDVERSDEKGLRGGRTINVGQATIVTRIF